MIVGKKQLLLFFCFLHSSACVLSAFSWIFVAERLLSFGSLFDKKPVVATLLVSNSACECKVAAPLYLNIGCKNISGVRRRATQSLTVLRGSHRGLSYIRLFQQHGEAAASRIDLIIDPGFSSVRKRPILSHLDVVLSSTRPLKRIATCYKLWTALLRHKKALAGLCFFLIRSISYGSKVIMQEHYRSVSSAVKAIAEVICSRHE